MSIFGNKKHEFSMEEAGVHMLFAMTVNLARRLNIPAEEFADIMDLNEETMEYLAESQLHKLKKKKLAKQ